MEVDPAQLQVVLGLYNEARMLRAYSAALEIGPLREWRGPAARVMAGRLAMNLGAPRLGRILHCLAYRQGPDDPQATYYYARALLERRGPWPAWQFLCQRGDLAGAEDAVRADWLAFHASVLGWLRDFQTAEQWLARAEQVAPQQPWLWIERAELMERQDRYEDALAAIRHCLELRPWYRPGIQQAAHLLQLLDRDQEAMQLLRDAAGRLENGPIVMQLAALETELGLYEQARQSWERVIELSPMLEKGFDKYIDARRSDAAYYCGDFEKAAELAERAKNPFHEAVAKKLRETQGRGGRVVLPVPFVRQHHMTCAPATLSALSRYWSMPAQHLEVAEAICYDGTPSHSERSWAQRNGYIVREFTVNWDATVALIDRGIPFTFATVEATSAHLQAVIGYDSLRGTLLIRDPYQRNFGEFLADATFQRYRSTGPRGMALVPKEQASRLDGIDLPDVSLHDLMHDLQSALLAHDRERARDLCNAMEQAAPEHRLSLWARRSLASYDADATGGLAAVEKLMSLYPDDGHLQLSKLSYLRVLARREERLSLLQSICDNRKSDPVFWLQLALELNDDARERGRTLALIRRTLRYRRADAATFHALGGLLWDQGRLAEAAQVYRFAACIGDMDEGKARSYFIACRHLKQTETALQMLRDRFWRFLRKSSHPARSLFWACDQLNREVEGFGALEEALRTRGQDGELQLFAAGMHARHGRFTQAAGLLDNAKGRCSPIEWLRASADVATIRGENAEALALWQQIVAADPLAADGHAALARLLAETQSQAAALEYLEKTADRFPHHYRLTQLWLEWLRDEGPARVEPVVRRLIGIHPADGWARRELAWALCQTGRLDEALAEAEMSLRLDPGNPSSPYFKGLVMAAMGRLQEADECYRAAIALSVDADFAIARYVNSCDTPAQKKEAMAFVQRELVRQTIFGDGLLAYRSHAREVLGAEELLASLREALAARPDLWHAWSAAVMQLSDMGRGEEAETLATQAAERFPLLPRIWLDLASVYRARGDFEAQAAALQTALELSPGWGQAVRALAELYEHAGEFEKSRQLLEQAIRRAPLDAYMHGCLADVLWKLGHRDAALAEVEQGVKLAPDYRWAWDMLMVWSRQLQKPQLAVDTARALTVARAGEARSWLVLARMLNGDAVLDERLKAVEKAIELAPRDSEAHDLRARLLAQTGRFDEALASCRPAGWGENVPSRLRARAAWIESQRGNVSTAIEQMRGVVQDDPNFYWAWTCLADWYRETRADVEYLATARTLIGLYPLDTVSLGYLGEALLRNKERDAARAALRKAIEQSPDYEFGAGLLFDLAMEDGDLHAAAQALQTLQVHSPGAMTHRRRGLLAIRRGDAVVASQCLHELCAPDGNGEDSIGVLAEAMDKAGMADRAEEVMLQSLAIESPPQGVAGRLVEFLARKKQWSDAREFAQSMLPREKLGREAASVLLFQLGSAEEAAELRAFLASSSEALKHDAKLWGWTAYALQSVRDYPAVVKWMSDWKQRQDAEEWMLVNLAEAYRALGKDTLAREVHTHAVALAGDARSSGIHTLWLAADAARTGSLERAVALLAKPEAAIDRPPYQFLRHMVEALIAARNHAGAAAVRERFQKAEAAHKKYAKDEELRRFRLKSLRRLILRGPGLGLRAWALGRRFRRA